MNAKVLIKFLPIVVVLAATLTAGTVYHAQLTDRFAPRSSERLGEFTKRIPMIPARIGDWASEDAPISDKEFKLTNCTAYKSARWVNKSTGQYVETYIVCGTGRHITMHSPDWCYQGAGYKMDFKPKNFDLVYANQTMSAECLTTVFRKSDTALRLFWTYSDDGEWVAPNSWGGAKTVLGGRPELYKIYFTSKADIDLDPTKSAVLAFANDVLPELNRVLFEGAGDGESNSSDDLNSDLDF